MGKGADVSGKYAAMGSDAVAVRDEAKEEPEQEEDGPVQHFCEKCKSSHDGEPRHGRKLLVCGACGKGWHNACLKPPLAPDEIPSRTWYCSRCRRTYAPDYSTFEEEEDIGDPHRGVPIVEPPGLAVRSTIPDTHRALIFVFASESAAECNMCSAGAVPNRRRG